jgi:hypothetical protein
MLGDRAALRVADSQLGLLTRAQALSSGLTDDQISHRLRTGSLVALHRGIYRTPGSATSFAQRALAGCLACGKHAVASHRTAAALFQLMDPPLGAVEVTTPSSHCRRPSGVVVHRSRSFRRTERVLVGAIPTASVGRLAGRGRGVLTGRPRKRDGRSVPARPDQPGSTFDVCRPRRVRAVPRERSVARTCS